MLGRYTTGPLQRVRRIAGEVGVVVLRRRPHGVASRLDDHRHALITEPTVTRQDPTVAGVMKGDRRLPE
jgi:hypothetical protein